MSNIITVTNKYGTDNFSGYDLDPITTDEEQHGLDRFSVVERIYGVPKINFCNNSKNYINDSFVTQMGDGGHINVNPDVRLFCSPMRNDKTNELSILIGEFENFPDSITEKNGWNKRGFLESPDSRSHPDEKMYFHGIALSNKVVERAMEVRQQIPEELINVTKDKGMILKGFTVKNSNGDKVTVSEHRHCTNGLVKKRTRVSVVPSKVYKMNDGLIAVPVL